MRDKSNNIHLSGFFLKEGEDHKEAKNEITKCCTPKFALSYFSKIFLLHGDHKHLIKGKIIFFKDKQGAFDWNFDRLRLSV